MEKAGLNHKDGLGYKFLPEMIELINRMRVKLTFPGSAGKKPGDHDYYPETVYEAKVWQTAIQNGMIQFRPFYPADTGPLPPVGPLKDEGFSLYTPDNIDTLKTIKAEFYLAEDKKAEEIPATEPVPENPMPYIPPLGVKRK